MIAADYGQLAQLTNSVNEANVNRMVAAESRAVQNDMAAQQIANQQAQQYFANARALDESAWQRAERLRAEQERRESEDWQHSYLLDQAETHKKQAEEQSKYWAGVLAGQEAARKIQEKRAGMADIASVQKAIAAGGWYPDEQELLALGLSPQEAKIAVLTSKPQVERERNLDARAAGIADEINLGSKLTADTIKPTESETPHFYNAPWFPFTEGRGDYFNRYEKRLREEGVLKSLAPGGSYPTGSVEELHKYLTPRYATALENRMAAMKFAQGDKDMQRRIVFQGNKAQFVPVYSAPKARGSYFRPDEGSNMLHPAAEDVSKENEVTPSASTEVPRLLKDGRTAMFDSVTKQFIRYAD
jgi:hypothetical protein